VIESNLKAKNLSEMIFCYLSEGIPPLHGITILFAVFAESRTKAQAKDA
jgi:hypothetical protein